MSWRLAKRCTLQRRATCGTESASWLTARLAARDPKDHGHANFADMVKALATVVELPKGKTDRMLRLR